MTVKHVVFTEVVDLTPDQSRAVHFRMTQARLDGVEKTVLVAEVADRGVAAMVDATESLEQLLEGRASGIFAGRSGGNLATKYTAGLTITLGSAAQAALFADLDPVGVSNDGSTWYYGQVDGTPAGAVVTLQHALGATLYKNAHVVNLAGTAKGPGIGFNYQPGIVEQLERPTPVVIAVADGGGDTVDVTVTPNDEDGALYFDVYVRSAVFTRIDPAWEPDLADQTSVAAALNLSTFNGGGDFVPDGSGGVLTSALPVWVGVVVKKTAGQTDIVESVCSNIVAHVLD